MRDVEHGAHAVQYMQQQCNHLGILCNNVDIKASVSLSLLVAMLLAYAYSPAANLITLHQNWSLMVISMSVFGYVMAMTAAGAFIEFPEWSTRPFR